MENLSEEIIFNTMNPCERSKKSLITGHVAVREVKRQCFESGFNTIGPLIRIWIRIRNPDPDPGGAKMTHKKSKKKIKKFSCFEVPVLYVLF